MAFIYDVSGNTIDISSSGSPMDYDEICKAIAHRGYSNEAPENTLPAYKLAKEKGFTYVECDICWTYDDIPVLSHDLTIDRCSNGTGTISQMTLSQLREYDFGSWKDVKYTGTKIPTFEEFIELCRDLGLRPYLDLRNMNSGRFQTLYDIYNAYGMKGKVTWISDMSNITSAKAVDPSARLGFLTSSALTAEGVSSMQSLQTGGTEVFLDISSYYADSSCVALCAAADIPMEIWTVNKTQILSMDSYITGCTSNDQLAGKVLYEAYMSPT